MSDIMTLSPSQIEEKLAKLRVEYAKSSRSQREIIRRQARALQLAKRFFEKQQLAG